MKILKIALPVLVVALLAASGWWYVSTYGLPWSKTTASLADTTRMLDEDADGLPVDLEKVFRTDSSKFDTDGDGYGDGEEAFNGYNPSGAGKIDPMNVADATSLEEALSGRRDAACLMKVKRSDADMEVAVRLYYKGAKFRQDLSPLSRGVPAENNLMLIRNGDVVYFGTNAKPKEWIQLEYSEKDGLAKNEVISLEGQTLLTKKASIDELNPEMIVCWNTLLDEDLFSVPADSILTIDQLKKEAEKSKQSSNDTSN